MIVVFGSLNVDLVLSTPAHARPGETVLCTSSVLAPGGKGNNQAVAAARAGGEVVLVGCVGDDALGAFLIDGLAANGLDPSRVRRVPGIMTGCASVAVDARGENLIYVAPGANGAAGSDDVADDLLARATTVVCQMEVPPAENWRLLKRAKHKGGSRTIVNYAPARDLEREGLGVIEQCVDVLVVNQREALQLAAHCALDRAGAEPAQVARCLAQRFDAACVMTLGTDGACTAHRENVWTVPSLRVEVADTTGAGDTFVGALAAMLDEGRSMPEAQRFAAVAASLACQKLGAQASMPDREEIEQHLALLASEEQELRARIASFSAGDRLSRDAVHRRGK